MKFEEFINWLNATENWFYKANGVNKAHISQLRQNKKVTKAFVGEIKLYNRELNGVIKDLESDYAALEKLGLIGTNKTILSREMRRFIQAIDNFTTSFEDLSGIAKKYYKKKTLKTVNEVINKSSELKSLSEQFYTIPVIGGKRMARGNLMQRHFAASSKSAKEANKKYKEFEEAKKVLSSVVADERKVQGLIKTMKLEAERLEKHLNEDLEIKTEEIKDLQLIIDTAKSIHELIKISYREVTRVDQDAKNSRNKLEKVAPRWTMLSKSERRDAKKDLQDDIEKIKGDIKLSADVFKKLSGEVYVKFQDKIKDLEFEEHREKVQKKLMGPLNVMKNLVEHLLSNLRTDLSHNQKMVGGLS
jgi:hypothetical protein